MTEAQRNQYRLEVKWLEKEIEQLASEVVKKPRKQRQINTYRKQIEQIRYQIDLAV